MKALVVGATGETGRRIVQELVARQIPVKAMVRNLDLGKAVLPPEAELVFGDVLQPESLKAGMNGCDVVLCATGARPNLDPSGTLQVDYLGTRNLVDVAKAQGIQKLVLVSSLCVSQLFHPLNLFWLVLYWKKQAETYLQQSGLTYTIVRPGGLKNDDNTEAILLSGPDTLFEGRIPRQKVASICVEALFQPSIDNKIVETVTQPDKPAVPVAELLANF